MTVPTILTNNIPQPTNIMVDSHSLPVNLVVRSYSGGVNLIHKQIPAQGTYSRTESQDEPSRHIHTVTKPIIQEIREIITPYRLVRQEIQPLREEVLTTIPKVVDPSFTSPKCSGRRYCRVAAATAAALPKTQAFGPVPQLRKSY